MNESNGLCVSAVQPDQMSCQVPIIHPGLFGLSPLQYPSSGLSEVSPLFLTGFSECADEAIKFLVEDEGLYPDDPMVVGLKNHLLEQRRVLELNLLLRNNVQLNSQDTTYMTCSEQGDDVPKSATISGQEYTDESNNVTDVNDCISELKNIHPESVEMENDKETDNIPQKVVNLVNELFSLLQEEEEEDLYLDSDSDIDEGFVEITENEKVL